MTDSDGIKMTKCVCETQINLQGKLVSRNRAEIQSKAGALNDKHHHISLSLPLTNPNQRTEDTDKEPAQNK